MADLRGTGVRLLAALRAADDRIEAIQAEWDTLPHLPGGGIAQDIRDAWRARRHQAEAEREAVARRVWGYFEGNNARGHYTGPGQATALEIAAWTISRLAWRYRSRS